MSDFSISDIYDAAMARMREQRSQAGQTSKAAYDKLAVDTQAAYEALDREAAVNKALSERAYGTAGDRIATLAQRRETNYQNTLGENARARERSLDTVELEGGNAEVRQAADETASSATLAALQNEALVSQSRFDKQLGLRQRELDLKKQSNQFSQAYQMMAGGMMDEKGFEGVTGIKVRKPPKPKKPPQYIVCTGGDSTPPDDGYEYYTNGVMETDEDGNTHVVWYHIRYDFYYDAINHEVELRNADGSYKTDEQVIMEMYGYIPEDGNYTETYENIVANEDEIVSKYGEDMYWTISTIAHYNGLMTDYRPSADAGETDLCAPMVTLTDLLNNPDEYIKKYGYTAYRKMVEDAFVEAEANKPEVQKGEEAEGVVSFSTMQEDFPNMVGDYQYSDSQERSDKPGV